MGFFVEEVPKPDKIEHSSDIETNIDNIPEKPVPNINYNKGLDVGTMNLVSSSLENNNDINIKNIRNVFIEIDKDSISNMDLSQINNVEIDDVVYIIGDDAYRFANMFNIPVSRPMSKGMISTENIDSADILAVMVRELIGYNEDSKNKPKCVYSIPANPIDGEMNVIYHQNVFARIINSLGYEAVPLNEATAIILSECSNTNFSGIGISFGAGMTNVALVYKSIPVITFSIARGGDWIDLNTANSLGMIPNKINAVKEKKDFSLTDFPTGKKKERRIKEGLIYYYNNLINYTLKNILKELEKSEAELPEELPLVISGGTSLAKGFIDLVKEQIDQIDEFPFDILEIRTAENQLTAVAQGCLVQALK